MELTGADIFVRCLADEGVEYVFGYPGGAALHIYDALYRQDKVKHILVRHEQGAAHAADGYARATGRPGVVLVTSGPGVTNTVTGIATAYMDSIPLVIISGSLLIESYFGIPGVGKIAFEAITNGDQPVLKAVVGLTAVAFVLIQVTADLLYRAVDPRVA